MTPGYIQLKVIVNKALFARGTEQYLPSEHSSSWLLNKLWATKSPWRRESQLFQEQPDYIRHLITIISFHCFNPTITFGRIIHILYGMKLRLRKVKFALCRIAPYPAKTKFKLRHASSLYYMLSPLQSILVNNEALLILHVK